MGKLIFIGSKPIKTENLDLIPGETYNSSDLSNPYLKSLKDQGFFEDAKAAEAPAKSSKPSKPK